MINRRNFLFFTVGLLPGCGFRLRGTAELAGKLPQRIRIETTDPYSPFIKEIIRQLTEQGTSVIASGSNPVLKLTLPISYKRILGPVSKGKQTELTLELKYSLIGSDLSELIPETKIRTTLFYVDRGEDTSAEDQRLIQLQDSLESDLLRQIVPSIRIRYEQALKRLSPTKVN